MAIKAKSLLIVNIKLFIHQPNIIRNIIKNLRKLFIPQSPSTLFFITPIKIQANNKNFSLFHIITILIHNTYNLIKNQLIFLIVQLLNQPFIVLCHIINSSHLQSTFYCEIFPSEANKIPAASSINRSINSLWE